MTPSNLVFRMTFSAIFRRPTPSAALALTRTSAARTFVKSEVKLRDPLLQTKLDHVSLAVGIPVSLHVLPVVPDESHEERQRLR